jgi:hypothetical protein
MKQSMHSRTAIAPSAVDAPARISGLCLPAIAWGLAAALASYLGFGLLLDAFVEPQTSVRVAQAAAGGAGHLFAASLSSLLGGALAGVIVHRRAGQRVALHAYGVWLAAALILWVQIAALSGGPPDL